MVNPVVAMSPDEQRLASAPPAGNRQTYDTGVTPPLPEPTPDDATQTLQDAEPEILFQTVDALIRGQDALKRSRYAIDTYYRWIDAGVVGARLSKVPNRNLYVAKLPPGATESKASVPNKANDLCNKFTEQLLADPPKPAARSQTNGTGNDETAEFANRFLRLDDGASGTNESEHYRWAIRNATTGASSFLWYWVDPTGGGSQPLQVLAHPQAQDPANPLVAMVPDPMTGQLIPQETPDPVLRYVSAPTPEAPAGQFVASESQADRVWIPKICVRRLRREAVTCYPATAPIWDASAASVLDFCTVSDAMRRWPETVGQMSSEQLVSLAAWRPPLYDTVTPFIFKSGMTDTGSGPGIDQVGSYSALAQRKMYFYAFFIRPCPEYPDGLECVVSGLDGGTLLYRGPLNLEVAMPDGSVEIRSRDIPLVQVTPNIDEIEMDPMGLPYASRFAGSAEAVANLYAAFLDGMHQRLYPHVFIRSTVPIDTNDWLSRDGLPTILNPQDPEPSYERFSTLPDIMGMSQDLHQQQDVSSGLTAAAQGLDTSTATSGVAKSQVIQAAKISMQLALQQLLAARTRAWRIKLQLVQAHFDTPQMMSYTGEDGSSEVFWLRKEDLAGVDDVGIEPGTGTLMTPEGKANYVSFLQQNGWVDPQEAKSVAVNGVAGDLGLGPDPVQQAIDRAITFWLQGPPESFQAEWQQYQAADAQFKQHAVQVMEQYRAQSTTLIQQGLDAPPPPDLQPPPMPMGPFTPKPNDQEPEVAQAWTKALSKLMFDPEYDAQPPEWQALVNQKYETCRQVVQAAQVPPPDAGETPKPTQMLRGNAA